MPTAAATTIAAMSSHPGVPQLMARNVYSAGAGAAVLNVVWILLAGWWLALLHLTTAVVQAITIIGIPLAVANLKLIPVSLVPYGKHIVPTDSLPPDQRPVHAL